MSENQGSSNSEKQNRGPLLAVLALAGLFLMAIAGISVWLAWHFFNHWQQAMTAPAQLPSMLPTSPIPTPQKQSGAIHGRVLASDGSPVSGATVFIALPGPSNLRIRNGKINFERSGPTNITHIMTGADGEYDLPPQTGNFIIEALSTAGYAQLNQDGVANKTDIQLIAWGVIQGRLMIGTKPGVGLKLHAYSIDQAKKPGRVRISMANFADTDANGNFTMNCVVPGSIQIARDITQHSGARTIGFTANIGTADVTPGQTTTVNLGGVGRPVVGKFIFPPQMHPSFYFINARAFGAQNDPATPDYYFLEVDEQHNFRMTNVVPGDYKISVLMQKVKDNTRARQPEQPQFTMPDIPGGASDEPLVIPDIQLQ